MFENIFKISINGFDKLMNGELSTNCVIQVELGFVSPDRFRKRILKIQT